MAKNIDFIYKLQYNTHRCRYGTCTRDHSEVVGNDPIKITLSFSLCPFSRLENENKPVRNPDGDRELDFFAVKDKDPAALPVLTSLNLLVD